MDWTVMDHEEANNPLVAKLAHDDSLTVEFGEIFAQWRRSYVPD